MFGRNQLLTDLVAVNAVDNQDACLLHLFTGKPLQSLEGGHLHSIAFAEGIFKESSNAGATSIAAGCEKDPWQFGCLLRFPQSLGHSMGAMP